MQHLLPSLHDSLLKYLRFWYHSWERFFLLSSFLFVYSVVYLTVNGPRRLSPYLSLTNYPIPKMKPHYLYKTLIYSHHRHCETLTWFTVSRRVKLYQSKYNRLKVKLFNKTFTLRLSMRKFTLLGSGWGLLPTKKLSTISERL